MKHVMTKNSSCKLSKPDAKVGDLIRLRFDNLKIVGANTIVAVDEDGEEIARPIWFPLSVCDPGEISNKKSLYLIIAITPKYDLGDNVFLVLCCDNGEFDYISDRYHYQFEIVSST